MINYNQIINDIKTQGYAEINSFINKDLKNEINNYFDSNIKNLLKNSKIDQFGNKSFALAGNELENTPIAKIKNLDEFKNLYRQILKKNSININDHIDVHNLLTVQENYNVNVHAKNSTLFHFDAFYLTILIPIKIPKINNSGAGELIIFPIWRNISFSSLFNFFIKLLTQNRLFRLLINTNYLQKILKSKKIFLTDDKIQIFYGYRQFHGNAPLSNKNLRVTLLHHIFRPHKDSYVDKYIFKRNELIRKNKLKYEKK